MQIPRLCEEHEINSIVRVGTPSGWGGGGLKST